MIFETLIAIIILSYINIIFSKQNVIFIEPTLDQIKKLIYNNGYSNFSFQEYNIDENY